MATIRDVARSSVNPGIAPENNQLPSMEIHRGDPSQFSRREPITDSGHQRRSPGDNAEARPAAKAANPNPGQADPMEQLPPEYRVVNAEDFVRESAAGSPNSSRYDIREPMTPEQALFGSDGERARADYGQAPNARQLPNTTTQDNNANARLGPRETTLNKESGLSFMGRGQPGAWEKGK
jgi:hypothetical protein